MIELSRIVSAIDGAATSAATAKAKQLKASGRDIIEMARGEPYFETPEHIRRAAASALARGETRYTPADGTQALKEAVRRKFVRDHGVELDAREISIGAGCKQVLYNAFVATLDPGDEVLIPSPCWDCYGTMVRLAGGTPVFVPTLVADGFRLQPGALARSITARTRWLVLTAPNNPTGVVYSAAELGALCKVLLEHPRAALLSDEIYEQFRYDSTPLSPLAIEPRLAPRMLVVGGVSKAYAMTGFRIGWGAGPRALVEAMARLQSNSTSNPCSISQAAAVEALDGSQDFLTGWRNELRERRDLALQRLNDVRGLSCARPGGALFAFVNIAELLGRRTASGQVLQSDADFVDALLEQEGVAVTAGSAFLAPGYFRLTYAVPGAALAEACARIARFCGALS